MPIFSPSYAANIFIRSVLTDLGDRLGGYDKPVDQERALAFFEHRCAYTGAKLVAGDTEMDHAVPLNAVHGGLHLRGNLVPCTKAANRAKGGEHFRHFLASEPERLARIEEFQRAEGYGDAAARLGDITPALQAAYERIASQQRELVVALGMPLPDPMPKMRGTMSMSQGTASREPSLPVTFDPDSPAEFMRRLLQTRRAIREEFYEDGRHLEYVWDAQQMKPESNVVGNIRSRAEYKAGKWRRAGILRVHVRVVDPNTTAAIATPSGSLGTQRVG